MGKGGRRGGEEEEWEKWGRRGGEEEEWGKGEE